MTIVSSPPPGVRWTYRADTSRLASAADISEGRMHTTSTPTGTPPSPRSTFTSWLALTSSMSDLPAAAGTGLRAVDRPATSVRSDADMPSAIPSRRAVTAAAVAAAVRFFSTAAATSFGSPPPAPAPPACPNALSASTPALSACFSRKDLYSSGDFSASSSMCFQSLCACPRISAGSMPV